MPSHYLKYNTRVYYWIRKLIKQSQKPEIVVLHSWEKANNNQINQAERLFIEHLNNRGHRLTNLTKGGEGQLGWIMPPTTKQKIAQTHLKLNKTMPSDHPLRHYQSGDNFKGRHHSEQTKAAISQQISIPIIRSDGKIFQSGREAAEYMGVIPATINHVLTGLNGSCQGYGFAYYKEGCQPPVTPPKTHKRTPIEYNGKSYKSISSAAKELNIPKTTFFRLVKNQSI
jgi:hypothetical protein